MHTNHSFLLRAVGAVLGQKRRDSQQKVDKKVDRQVRIALTEKEYNIYFCLTVKGMAQVRIAQEENVSRQYINKITKRLLMLGLLEPVKHNANPCFYKSTDIIPVVSTKKKIKTPVVSTKSEKRILSKKPSLVRHHDSGKIKHWRRKKLDLEHRDYDTLLSVDGKRVKICRVHGYSYSCSIIHKPVEIVPWKPVKKGMKGMDQYDYKHKIPHIGRVSFRLQTTKNTEELIIWLPVKWIFPWELEEGEKLLEKAVWKARKYFQDKFKAYLGLPLQYRTPKYAFEIWDPMMKRFVHEKGTVDVVTSDGIVEMDESLTDYQEVEFPSVRQAIVYANEADRILGLERQMEFVMRSQRMMSENMNKLIEGQKKLIESQKKFTDQMQEVIGLRKEVDKLKERENQEKMFQ